MDKAKGNSGKAGGPGFFDLLIILFCTAGTFFCLYLFYNDFTRTLSKQAESPVGTISYKYRAAQRRFEDRVLWDRLQQDSPVYNGDFVRTSGLSEATVSFSGGVAVDIAENSLIQITSENTVPRVEVNQGGIDIKAQDSMILIVSKGRRIEVSGGSVISARSGPGDQVDLMVIQGAAAIMNGQEITHAGPGEAFAVGENTLEATPRLIALRPYPNELILSPDSQGCPVDFLFSTSGSSLILTLEISSSRSFSQVQTLRVENSQARAVLRPGIWWWRAYPADDPQGGQGAFPGKITVMHFPPPLLRNPQGGQVFSFVQEFPRINFRWEGAEPVEGGESPVYLLEASDNPGMNNPRLAVRTSLTALSTSELGPGQWYWRVTPSFGGEGGTALSPSPAGSFVIEQIQSFGLSPGPEEPRPLEAPALSLAGTDPQGVLLLQPGEPARLRWLGVAGADYYRVNLYRKEGEERVYSDLRVPGTGFSLVMDDYPEGAYFWTVQAVAEETLESPLRTGSAASLEFSLTKPAAASLPSPPASPVPPLRPAAPLPPVPVAPAPPASAAAPPFPPPVLSRPANLNPVNEAILGSAELRGKTALSFTWDAVEGAAAYRWTLYKAGEVREKILERTVETPSFSLEDFTVLSRGDFIWQVHPEAGEERGPAVENRFRVDLPPVQRSRPVDLGVLYGEE